MIKEVIILVYFIIFSIKVRFYWGVCCDDRWAIVAEHLSLSDDRNRCPFTEAMIVRSLVNKWFCCSDERM
jgi:hypothetical protein